MKWKPADDVAKPREELANVMMQLMVFGGDTMMSGYTQSQKDIAFVMCQFGVAAGLMTPMVANKYLLALKGECTTATAVTLHSEQNEDWNKATADYQQ